MVTFSFSVRVGCTREAAWPHLSVYSVKLLLGFLLMHCSYSRSNIISELNLYYSMNKSQIYSLLLRMSTLVNQVSAAPVKLFRKVWTNSLSYISILGHGHTIHLQVGVKTTLSIILFKFETLELGEKL